MDDGLVITLFRHGLTEENERHAYIGWTDSPLSKQGRAELSGKMLTPCHYVATSDLKRCRQTAELLFEHVSQEVYPEFREMNFGNWEGKTYEQLKDAGVYRRWLEDPFHVSPPQGESFQAFAKRIDQGWKKLKRKIMMEQLSRVVLVTHGGVIRYLLSTYSKEKTDFRDWNVSNGYGYALIWESRDMFRRGETCTSLREVPLTEKQSG
ncbi:histidine phosphatase family protein [Sporolactobacillus sp. THM19-2]|uniref:histidine phosphatase family protein n=1 Tax=Sporolactobacillus sp. THM19-2 TaxID=2511171 RepID=UPI001020F774|nr:histidine phosphatase family protein [Sporolactobacillus sp. THM19-2]RYL88135.1 histidine phosphatase family protein [Sporolactobacillus sp. THM19-2]